MNFKLLPFILLSSLLIVSSSLFANQIAPNVISIENDDINASNAYWTPERMREAKPMEFSVMDTKSILHNADYPSHTNEHPISRAGRPPTAHIKPNMKPIYQPRNNTSPTYASFDRGTSGATFSSSQIVPLTADLTFPYTTVGKLFFTQPSGDFFCSGAVIANRIVVSAGNCIHSGSNGNGGFFTNFRFVPAFRDGAAPFQSWTFTFATVTNTWATSNGVRPNAANYGMLEFADQNIGGTIKKLGDLTGFLGFKTLSLNNNHAHLFGYSANFDNGNKMHQVTAESAALLSPNNVQYGSDMIDGSAGGPFIQNFGIAAVGQTDGSDPTMNVLIGVNEFRFSNTAVLINASSILNDEFTNLFSSICAHKAGNC